MTDLFIDGWTYTKAERYTERYERMILGSVVRHAQVVAAYPAKHQRDHAAIREREQRMQAMAQRSAKVLPMRKRA